MRRNLACHRPAVALVCFVFVVFRASILAEEKVRDHPLLPGVRSPEVFNEHWPVTLHDKLLTGFSPVTCGMKHAPGVWATSAPGGRAMHAEFLTDARGETFLLVQDGSLRRVDSQGHVVWKLPAHRVLFYDPLYGES
ncbi:MAG: hypothetical protein ABIP48_05635 [Planctomycetota bacterium]